MPGPGPGWGGTLGRVRGPSAWVLKTGGAIDGNSSDSGFLGRGAVYVYNMGMYNTRILVVKVATLWREESESANE